MATNDKDTKDTGKKHKEIRRGRLPGKQRYRLNLLLNMKYKPNELAKALDIDVRWFYRVYVPLGCPHERDQWRHIWIVGTEFREWYHATYRNRKLAKNEAYCVSCREPVPIINPEEHEKDCLNYLLSDCPVCGRTVAKILANQRRKQ